MILSLMQCTNLGGMEKSAFCVMSRLRSQLGWEFRIISPRPLGLGASLAETLDPSPLGHPYCGRFGWRTHHMFRQTLDSVALQCSVAWITGTCAASLWATRAVKLPVVLSHHFHHFDGFLRTVEWALFYHGLCRHVRHVIYPTNFTRNEALRIAPNLKKKSSVCPYGFATDFLNHNAWLNRRAEARRILKLPQDSFVVGNAGWFIKRKRPDLFLETARMVKNHCKNAFFVLVGGGPLEQSIKDSIAKLSLSDCTRIVPWTSEIEPHLRSWDINLFVSDFDTLPRTPIEACASGAVVVASVGSSGMSEFFVHGQNGYLFVDHDPTKLSGSILQLHRNPHLFKEIQEAAIDQIRGNFSETAETDYYASALSA